MRSLIFLFLLFISSVVMAASLPSTWTPAAQLVCHQINQASAFYQKGDIKNARSWAIMSYFKGYDSEIEPAIRTILGGPHVFLIERKFRDFSILMTPQPDKKQLKKVADFAAQLCQAVNEDAKALNAAHVQRQVFKVE